MTYEPNPYAQADIEATEWVRSRTLQRQTRLDEQVKTLIKEVNRLHVELAAEVETRRMLESDLSTKLYALEDELATQRRVTAQMMRERA